MAGAAHRCTAGPPGRYRPRMLSSERQRRLLDESRRLARGHGDSPSSHQTAYAGLIRSYARWPDRRHAIRDVLPRSGVSIIHDSLKVDLLEQGIELVAIEQPFGLVGI